MPEANTILDDIAYVQGLDEPHTFQIVTPFPVPVPFNITPEPTTMSDFNPDDATAVSRFFQSLADKVVLASTLPKEVEELRKAVDQLKQDVESYREHVARADEEITRLRQERQALQDANGQLSSDLINERSEHTHTREHLTNACNERDRWHNDFISASTELETVKRERDDAQIGFMQLEDRYNAALRDIEHWQSIANEVSAKLASIRSALS